MAPENAAGQVSGTSAFGWTTGKKRSSPPLHPPRWLRVMGLLMAAYCVVLLGVFLEWQAAALGCLIVVCVESTHA